ncbi:hypothetical protein FB451DRAFT_1283418 [Mycena latifolia]|nr:hypothetical protein FB451DRAFT_1283418 [Mycena latifolia]
MRSCQMYAVHYIQANAHIFLDTAWINISALRSFLAARDRRELERDIFLMPSSSPAEPSARVQSEFDASDVPSMDRSIKSEPSSGLSSARTRSVVQGGREVIELLSDSDEEGDLTAPKTHCGGPRSSASSPGLDQFLESESGDASSEPNSAGDNDPSSESDDFDAGVLRKSDTVWLDSHVSSMVRTVKASFTSDQRTYVEEIEYLTELSSGYPVPRVPKAFVIDCSDPKFNVLDKHGNLLPVDVLIIKGEDNDSWNANGGSSSLVEVTFVPGESKILCRRSRADCKGLHACTAVDLALLDAPRYELDAVSRDVIFAAQRETRRTEGETAEQRATAFFDRVKSMSCTARHSDGRLCAGKPKLQAKPEGTSRGHDYFICCNGWTPQFKESHRCHSIPDNVQQQHVIKVFAGEPLANDNSLDTNPCSRVVHPHIAGKLEHCLTFYIPVDSSIRKVLLFHPKGVPHNHTIAAPLKLSHGSKSKYRKCVEAVGFVGSTVTKLILDGHKPSQFDSALLNKRLKRDIIWEEKKKAYPAGLGVTGLSLVRFFLA